MKKSIYHTHYCKDLSIKDDATELLIEQIGNNLRQFDGELDKLKLIAYPEKTITKKMVEDIAISNQDLFNITEMIIKNQKDKALLEFKKLTDKEIQWYLDTDEWHGVAGGYRIQGKAQLFIKNIKGSHSSIMGLSISDFYEIMQSHNYSIIE